MSATGHQLRRRRKAKGVLSDEQQPKIEKKEVTEKIEKSKSEKTTK